METLKKHNITVKTTINAPIKKVWSYWSNPRHIVEWNAASDDWQTAQAQNDLRVDGKFRYHMEAKDKSVSFAMEGTYTEVVNYQRMAYTLDDARNVTVDFAGDEKSTTITETFEAENVHSHELQQSGWQAILDNFKKYVESIPPFEKIHFEVTINAPVEKVYKTMIDKAGYSAWTVEFNPSSRFEGSWDKGSKIVFLGEDENGELGGMVSFIKENKANEFISIEHQGIVMGGQEATNGYGVEEWAGVLENYTFTKKDSNTVVAVDIDTNADFKAYFEEKWPKALGKLKFICEA